MAIFENRPVNLKPIAIAVICFRYCNSLKKRAWDTYIRFLIFLMVFQIAYNSIQKEPPCIFYFLQRVKLRVFSELKTANFVICGRR